MADIPWYAEAALVGPGHVFCVGSLAQCVRKWATLVEVLQAPTFIRLEKEFDGRKRLDREQISVLAADPELMRV
jgi:hypothetical protein